MKTYGMLYVDNISLDTKNIRPIIQAADIDDSKIAEISAVYDKLLKAIEYVNANLESLGYNDEEEKAIKKRVITKTHLISVMNVVATCIKKEHSDEALGQFLAYFFNGGKDNTSIDEEYNTNCTDGSGHTAQVKTRKIRLGKRYDSFIKKYKKALKDSNKEENSNQTTDMEEELEIEDGEEAMDISDEINTLLDGNDGVVA